MTVVPDKYRGTGAYRAARQALISAARDRGTVKYIEIVQIAGLPTSGNVMSRELGQVLGEISEDEHLDGRPMLSAAAIGADGAPGGGFFGLARLLGKLDDSPDNEQRFWISELKSVHDHWQRHDDEALAH